MPIDVGTGKHCGYLRPYGNGDWQLYNLAEDPGEVQNVAAQHPDLVAELALEWTAYAERNGVIHPDTPVRLRTTGVRRQILMSGAILELYAASTTTN